MAKQIEFIRNGTVIDHIKAGEAFQVLEILKLTDHIRKGDCKVMIGCNFESGAHSFKDIIKISNGFLTHKELNQITLIAPKATVSIIRNFKIVEKFIAENEHDTIYLKVSPNFETLMDGFNFILMASMQGGEQSEVIEKIKERLNIEFNVK